MVASSTEQNGAPVDAELERRYSATVRVLFGVLFAVIALVAFAFIFSDSVTVVSPIPNLIFPLWIVMVVSAIGVVVYRRAKFSAIRLQAVADTRGTSGLIASLQHTTVNITLICLGIAGIGFTITMLTGDLSPVWGASVVRGAVIALLLLVGCFPRRGAWRQTVAAFEPSAPETTSTKGSLK